MYRIIGADGKEYGPISAEQLRRWIVEGRANGQTRILPEGTTEWRTVAEFPEFASDLGGPGASPVTPLSPMPGPGSQPDQTNALAIWSLVLGILSLPGVCCCMGLPFSVPGLITGILALTRIKEDPRRPGKGMALAGVILSALSIVLGIALVTIRGFMDGPDLMKKIQEELQKR